MFQHIDLLLNLITLFFQLGYNMEKYLRLRFCIYTDTRKRDGAVSRCELLPSVVQQLQKGPISVFSRRCFVARQKGFKDLVSFLDPFHSCVSSNQDLRAGFRVSPALYFLKSARNRGHQEIPLYTLENSVFQGWLRALILEKSKVLPSCITQVGAKI
jgi:hypothetical protein